MPWFHGKISREVAEKLLTPRTDGLFLASASYQSPEKDQITIQQKGNVFPQVRESTNFPGDYTLCVCFESRVEHYRIILQVCYVCDATEQDWVWFHFLDLESYKIIVQEEKITIDEEEYFENLNQLVEVGEL